MAKKLKNMQYTSKKEFADDLYLIWSNCMIYSILDLNFVDSHPDNLYRKHGAAMKKRTTELLRRIPEDRSLGDGSESDEEDFFMEDQSDIQRDSVTPSIVDSDKPAPLSAYRKEDLDISDDSLVEPVFCRKWQDLTLKKRLENQNDWQSNVLFAERRAIVTDPEEMYLYILGNELRHKRELFRQRMRLSETGRLVMDSFYLADPLTRIGGFGDDIFSSADSAPDIGMTEFFLPELFTRGACLPSIPNSPVYVVDNYVIGPADLFKSQYPR